MTGKASVTKLNIRLFCKLLCGIYRKVSERINADFFCYFINGVKTAGNEIFLAVNIGTEIARMLERR